MESLDTTWIGLIMTYLALLGLIFFRYVLVSGIFYLIFYVLKFDEFKGKKISSRLRKPNQSKKEIYWSFLSSIVFAVGGTFMIFAWQSGHTKIYDDLDLYGYWFLPVSALIVLFAHETYYYWLHRWMHIPSVYPYIHKTHHDSIVTSPWTSFSFHPIESVFQTIFVPAMIFIVPMHWSVVLILLVLMTVSATINHLDIEIYPKNFNRNIIGKWLIGATHHSLHHSEFVTNYGLYFTFWDLWMDTESEKYDEKFDELTA